MRTVWKRAAIPDHVLCGEVFDDQLCLIRPELGIDLKIQLSSAINSGAVRQLESILSKYTGFDLALTHISYGEDKDKKHYCALEYVTHLAPAPT